jgi:photosystem II stability/assembly factor-like uncharacterized protein
VNASTGYSGALMRDLAVVNGEPGWIYAAARSGLFRSTDGGASWQGTAFPGEDLAGLPLDEVVALALHPTNPLIILSAPIDLMGIAISRDGGQSWSIAKGQFSHPNSIEFAPGDPSVVYAANFTDKCMKDAPGAIELIICGESKPGLYVSRDEGQTWNKTGESEITRSGILALAVHPTDPDTVFIGTRNGVFAVSKDGGQTWKETPQDQIPPEEIRTIAVDPGSPDTLYIGYEGMGIYKTTDGGDSWRMLTAGMPPEADVRSIVVDPMDSNVVYLTDMRSGVLYSIDGGERFQPLNEGLTHRTARTLAISDDGSVLYVGIEGAGVYRLGTPPIIENADSLFDDLPTGETLQSEFLGETDEKSQPEESLETEAEQDGFEAEQGEQPDGLE